MGKSDIEYLEEERKKIWQRVNSLEVGLDRAFEEINKKTSDYTDEAKQSSRKASEYRNRSEEARNTITTYLEEASQKLNEIKEKGTEIDTLFSDIKDYAANAAINDSDTKKISEEIIERKTAVESQIQSLEEIFSEHDTLTEKVEKIEEILTKSDETSSKIETLHSALLSRKKEIDQIYLQIFGYKITEQETDKETVVEGLKDKLAKSYDGLSENIKHTEEALSNLRKVAGDNYEVFSQSSKTELESTLTKWNEHYLDLSNKIQALLPNALTAGLSSAYSEKKDTEIKEYRNLNRTFIIAICGLVFVSLIPFAVGTYSLAHDKTFDKVLLDMPRMVLSILPLYIPVLWVAYSSNRKMNLSKRLSEEYSHKEVLSKTFEGLSTQINNISDQKVSVDLRNKLLFNILEVSSENPGKLISDYNKSDHPLMDALDKSVKLAAAFEKLETIPGLSSLAKKLDRKSKAILKDESEKADIGIALLNRDEEVEA